MSLVHFDMYPSQVKIIHKQNYNKTPFVPNTDKIKLDFFLLLTMMPKEPI